MFFGKRFHGHHKSDLSGLEILVLSIIKNKNTISGYDISQTINNNFRGMWKASARPRAVLEDGRDRQH